MVLVYNRRMRKKSTLQMVEFVNYAEKVRLMNELTDKLKTDGYFTVSYDLPNSIMSVLAYRIKSVGYEGIRRKISKGNISLSVWRKDILPSMIVA